MHRSGGYKSPLFLKLSKPLSVQWILRCKITCFTRAKDAIKKCLIKKKASDITWCQPSEIYPKPLQMLQQLEGLSQKAESCILNNLLQFQGGSVRIFGTIQLGLNKCMNHLDQNITQRSTVWSYFSGKSKEKTELTFLLYPSSTFFWCTDVSNAFSTFFMNKCLIYGHFIFKYILLFHDIFKIFSNPNLFHLQNC